MKNYKHNLKERKIETAVISQQYDLYHAVISRLPLRIYLDEGGIIANVMNGGQAHHLGLHMYDQFVSVNGQILKPNIRSQ